MKAKWMCAAATAALLIGSAGAHAQVPEKKQEPGATTQQQAPSTGAQQNRQTAPGSGTAGSSQSTGDAKPETAQDKQDGGAKQSGTAKEPATRSTQSKDQDSKAVTREGKDTKSSAQSGSSGTRSKDTAQSGDDKSKSTAQSRDKSDTRNRADQEDESGRRASGKSQDQQTTSESADEKSDRVQVTERERTTIQESVDVEKARTDVDIDVNIGARVPRSVELHPLPATIIGINPRWRSYRYVVVQNEIVIINPQTYAVVEVIPVSGSRQARSSGGGARASVQLSTQQRQRILTYARAECDPVTTEPGFQIGVGVRIPERIELCPFEDVIIQEVGVVQPYRFFVVENQVVLVDPSTQTIVEVVR